MLRHADQPLVPTFTSSGVASRDSRAVKAVQTQSVVPVSLARACGADQRHWVLVNALTVDVEENFQVPAFAGGGVPESASLRRRLNLGRVEGRLKQLLADFRWDRIDAVFTEVAEGAAAQPARVL